MKDTATIKEIERHRRSIFLKVGAIIVITGSIACMFIVNKYPKTAVIVLVLLFIVHQFSFMSHVWRIEKRLAGLEDSRRVSSNTTRS